jgi:molybdopterin-guanine dinucleotide biosynthesis protein A
MTAAPTTSGGVAAAVIAGGRGERMGGAVKAALVVDGRSIAERQIEALRREFARVLVVANEPGPWSGLGVEIIPDRRAGAGPLGGIEAALAATRSQPGVVCVAGDMPFLPPGLLALLRDRAPEADAVAPRVAGRPEPLLARYAGRCLPVVEAALARGENAVHALLASLDVAWIDEAELRAVDPTLSALTNINTPEDLARAGSRDLGPRRS